MTPKTIVTILAVIFVALTGLSTLRLTHWWVRAFDFPRPQIALTGIALFVAYIIVADVRKWDQVILMIMLTLAVGFQVRKIWPYTPLHPVEVVKAREDWGEDISLFIANVFMENREAGRVLAAARERDPDVILLVEVDDWWVEQTEVLRESHPWVLSHPLPNTYGMVLYSKLELVDGEIEFLIQEDVPSIAVDLRLDSGRLVRFHGLHPRPPAPTEALDTTERDGELLKVARRVRDHEGPSIVTGDLNDVAWSSTTALLKRIGGLLDPRVGRGLYSTFHAEIPILRWPLDHVFHTDHFQLVEIDRLSAIGSDHFPVYAHLVLTPEAPQVQDAPTPEPGDRTRAVETIQEAEELGEQLDEEKKEEAAREGEGEGSTENGAPPDGAR